MCAIEYKCAQPPFDPSEEVDRVEVRGKFVHVTQNGYCYKAGPFFSKHMAKLQAESHACYSPVIVWGD